jgi:alanine racemase
MVINHATVTTDVLRPTQVEVDLGRLSANLDAIRARVRPAKVMTVLKANAYGHGMVEVARHMVASGADSLGVAFLEEGILLRQRGIEAPILVLGGIIGNQIPLFLQHDLALTASSIGKLEQIEEAAGALGAKATVHLKIDTGMERLGVHYYSAEGLLDASLRCRHCAIEGIYTHFANADAADLTHARLQIERFQEVLRFYERRSLPVPTRHMANSAAILQLPESHLDLVRAGILLYGVYPSASVAHTVAVSPALAWKSRVVFFKVVQPDHPVSYGSTWVSDHPVRVVTLPVGYGDGYFRSLSNRGKVIIRGKTYPVIGTVCMDQTMVDIEGDSAYNGDEVVLLGESGGSAIRVEDLAAWAGTIPYEVLTNINTRVPRVYVGAAQRTRPGSFND